MFKALTTLLAACGLVALLGAVLFIIPFLGLLLTLGAAVTVAYLVINDVRNNQPPDD